MVGKLCYIRYAVVACLELILGVIIIDQEELRRHEEFISEPLRKIKGLLRRTCIGLHLGANLSSILILYLSRTKTRVSYRAGFDDFHIFSFKKLDTSQQVCYNKSEPNKRRNAR